MHGERVATGRRLGSRYVEDAGRIGSGQVITIDSSCASIACSVDIGTTWVFRAFLNEDANLDNGITSSRGVSTIWFGGGGGSLCSSAYTSTIGRGV